MMKHIFLIGVSGSGKSTVGCILAQRLGRKLLDIDTLIEAACGASIPELFTLHGEAYFRDCERRVMASAVQEQEPAIIVTGGGVVTHPENRAIMAEQGIRVFLQVDPSTALQRLQAQHATALTQGHSPEVRPLLAGPDPLARLQRLLAERQSWYEEAEIVYPTQEKQPEQIARQIIAQLIANGEVEGRGPSLRHVCVGSGYDAIVDWGGLGRLPRYLQELQLATRIFLITDCNVQQLYGTAVEQQLTRAGFEPSCYTIPAGESSKSPEQLAAIYDWLVEQRAERREAIIALGGGVVGDLVGYIAATYLRGVPLIHIPTSLVAQVDSAIGGKTGINHKRGKNLIGTFYHPHLVLADPATLLTLPTRERTEGWAEVVKYGIILDAELFALLETHVGVLRDFSGFAAPLICDIIERCIALKAAVIEDDEREQGRRAILNYGHTVGHALENVAGYGEWLHGEAVSLGMVVAASLAVQADMFAAADASRQNALLAAFGLPTVCQGTSKAQDILAAIQFDKKVSNQRLHWILPRAFGQVEIVSLPDELIRRTITSFFA